MPSTERPEEASGRAHSHARAHSRACAHSRAPAHTHANTHANTGPPHFLRQLRLTVTWIGFYDAAHVIRGALPRDLSLGGCHQR